jgi:hypothetical protein
MVAVATAAVFATSGVAVADTETGQHGNYVFRDDSAKFGATCVYASQGGGKYKLTKIVVKPPWLWWPDTNSDNNRERGTVGWAMWVQISKPGAYGPWHTLYTSPRQDKRAYEDQPAYDKADAARLPTMTLNINGGYKKKPNAHARIVHDAVWLGSNSTLGEVTHEQLYYAVQGIPGQTGLTTACPIHWAAL